MSTRSHTHVVAALLCLAACHSSPATAPAWSGATSSGTSTSTSVTSTSTATTVPPSTSDDTSGAPPTTTTSGSTTTGNESTSSTGPATPTVDCSTVAHVGDSLTAYTVRALTAAYAAVGVTATIDAFGGRAILQKLPDDPHTGEDAATAIAATGFTGCWVVALGTNDTANIAAGAGYTRGEAIDAMMTAIDVTATAPVMWVNTFTTRDDGYWANDNMIAWNEALVAALERWPNLVVDDWAAVAATGAAPYSDGIHHTGPGSDVRNAHIAEALVGFFPLP